jgi:hypothetical protein
MPIQSETRPLGAAGLGNASLLGGFDGSELTPKVPRVQDKLQGAIKEIERIRSAHPADFKDGVALGLGKLPTGTRDPGDYPAGFHGWPLSTRNAWFAGFNFGFCRRPHDAE